LPLYCFEHVETGEIREIFFHMLDQKVYEGEGGTEVGLWERRYYIPQMGIDTKNDPFDSKKFAETSGKKKGTLGDLFDASKEASMKREKLVGKDFWKDEHIKNYKEKRKGKSGMSPKHPSEISQNWDITVK
jgi:hypothetical protein